MYYLIPKLIFHLSINARIMNANKIVFISMELSINIAFKLIYSIPTRLLSFFLSGHLGMDFSLIQQFLLSWSDTIVSLKVYKSSVLVHVMVYIIDPMT